MLPACSSIGYRIPDTGTRVRTRRVHCTPVLQLENAERDCGVAIPVALLPAGTHVPICTRVRPRVVPQLQR